MGAAGRTAGRRCCASAREGNEADGTWRAWGVAGAGDRRAARAQRSPGSRASLHLLERPEACQQVLRRVGGLDGKICDAG